MVSEDLYLSFDEVRVRYRFRNESNRDVATRIAFPLPQIDVGEDIGYSLTARDPRNAIGFTVEVDGRKVAPELELRATVHGVDRTEVLKRHGLRILPFAEDFYTRLEKLPVSARAELEEVGLADWRSAWGANDVPLPTPHWIAHATFHWRQVFPAGKTVEVTHRYAPVPGAGFYGAYILEEQGLRGSYCMDAGFRKAVRRLIAKKPNGVMRELHYVLTTGANWKGAIGDFRLTIDKGKPGNLISLCIDNIRKTGPTTFEMRAKQFVPERDLKILLIEADGG
jgi:hypothetical protein